MPAPTCVTHDQIIQAMTQLAMEGEPATGWRLRRIIGAGNPHRLQAVARELAAAPAALDGGETPAMPGGLCDLLANVSARLTADLRQVVGHAWSQAADISARRVAGEIQAARARVTVLEDELAQAEEAIEEVDARAAELAAEVEAADGAARADKGMREHADKITEETLVRLNMARDMLADLGQQAAVTSARVVELGLLNVEAERRALISAAERDAAVAELQTYRDRAVGAEAVVEDLRRLLRWCGGPAAVEGNAGGPDDERPAPDAFRAPEQVNATLEPVV